MDSDDLWLGKVANWASYPQWDEKWVVAYLVEATGWRPSVADWGVVRVSGCIAAGPKYVSAGNGRLLACAVVL